ncbi:MAG: hypothetical protein ACREED_07480, partial [Stellaceae bacterium]
LHHSPTRSRLRAIGHCILPKLLRCMAGLRELHRASNRSRSHLHHASYWASHAETVVSGVEGFGPRRLPHSGLGPRRLLTTLPSCATVATAAILTLNLVLVLDVLAVAEG